MYKHYPVAALAAALALAACDSKPANSTDTANAAANAATPAAKVELPPAVKSSKQYRCKDETIVTINLFDGDKLANVREDGVPILMLKAEEAGKPFVAEGAELTVQGNTATLTRPGHPKQDCIG